MDSSIVHWNYGIGFYQPTQGQATPTFQYMKYMNTEIKCFFS